MSEQREPIVLGHSLEDVVTREGCVIVLQPDPIVLGLALRVVQDNDKGSVQVQVQVKVKVEIED